MALSNMPQMLYHQRRQLLQQIKATSPEVAGPDLLVVKTVPRF